MKVQIVEFRDGESTEIIGVFREKGKAQLAAIVYAKTLISEGDLDGVTWEEVVNCWEDDSGGNEAFAFSEAELQ